MNNTIGGRIKQFRIQNNLTQAELSKLINKSTSTIRKYESNDRKPSIDVLENIADVFKIDINTLCGVKVRNFEEKKFENETLYIDDLADYILDENEYKEFKKEYVEMALNKNYSKQFSFEKRIREMYDKGNLHFFDKNADEIIGLFNISEKILSYLGIKVTSFRDFPTLIEMVELTDLKNNKSKKIELVDYLFYFHNLLSDINNNLFFLFDIWNGEGWPFFSTGYFRDK